MESENQSALEQNLLLLAYDRDPRVRIAAVQGMEALFQDYKNFSMFSYSGVTKLCEDTETNVRLAALRIIQIFAEKYKDIYTKNAKGFRLRLHDDAFVIVCHAINDGEPLVRAEATKLLGRFSAVSDYFLEQTLDKKLMRQMKMVGDSSTAAIKLTTSGGGGGWCTGKKLGEDVPMEKDDDDSNSLMPSGACGAFVTALEDEFMSVRQAAVHSLGQLTAKRTDFARLCIDHLADMFNDEIQQVRLDAINALVPLVTHGSLYQDQLYTVLTVLDDAATENRMAVHDLISNSNLADVECVRQCIRVLLHSLKRFPIDKSSIYRCLSAIGLKHSSFIHGLVTELLEIHPIFDTPEQNIDDDFYLGKLILVLNAASQHSVICSLMPPYVKKHYRYLRCTSNHLIPIVKTMEESKSLILIDSKLHDINDDNASKSIRVIEPSHAMQKDCIIRFVSCMPTGIHFSCILYNLSSSDVRRFRIRVMYPDYSLVYFRPKDTDFHQINPGMIRLHTTVVISASVWAEAANLHLVSGIFKPAVKPIKRTIKKIRPERTSPQFHPLVNSDLRWKHNEIFVKVHPMLRA